MLISPRPQSVTASEWRHGRLRRWWGGEVQWSGAAEVRGTEGSTSPLFPSRYSRTPCFLGTPFTVPGKGFAADLPIGVCSHSTIRLGVLKKLLGRI